MTTEQKTTQITEYSQTAAAIGELRQRYENVIFPVDTPKGMKDALAARKELRDLRIGLEKLRKDIKAPALLRCQLIDSEAKEITSHLTALEDPIDAQIKEEEQRKEKEKAERERVERERVQGIRTLIDAIARLPLDSAGDTAEDIEATLADLQAIEIGDEYAEFRIEAHTVKDNAIAALTTLHALTKTREDEAARLKAEREELDREKAELERQRAEIEAAKIVPPVEAPSEPVQSLAEALGVVPETAFQVGIDLDPTETVERDVAADPSMDADQLVSELAGYTAMQFLALADKVASIGQAEFAAALRNDAEAIASGAYNEKIKLSDWLQVAEADKRMALASHACVSILVGDEPLGTSVLRQAA